MIAVNTYFDPVSMLFNEKQGGFMTQSPRKSANSFEDVLNNTVKQKDAEPVQRENQQNRVRDTRNVTNRYKDDSNDVQTQQTQSADNQDNQVNDTNKVDDNQKAAKNDDSDSKNDNKDSKLDALSDSDKAAAKEMADKLNVNPETFMNLLQSLNIDFKDLMQNSANLEEALKKVTAAVENTVQKLNLNPIALQNKDLRAKIELLVNNQKHAAHNEAADKKQFDELNADVKANDNSQATDTKTDMQTKVHVGLQNKDERVENDNQVRADVTSQFEKKVVSQKSGKGFEGMDNNQQSQQDAGKGAVKNNDKVDMQAVLNNVKVVNLKTAPKEGQSTESTKVDSLNALPMQKLDSITSKVIPLTQAAKEANVNKSEIFSQVVENAKLTLSDKQTEMEMNLKPESLGKLSIKIASENGLIMAKITTESEQVKAIIESNLAQLKEQLQQQGLSVQDFSVSVGQDPKQQFFANQNKNSGSRSSKVQGISQNTVTANESYVNRIMVKNPYLMSDSSIDYTA